MGGKHTRGGEMTRTMFPFDDLYRVTFTGSFLPSQNEKGEITPPTVPDPRYEVFPLDEAPKIPLWRAKRAMGSTSSTPTSSTDNSPSASEIGDEALANSVTSQLQITSTNGKTISTTTDASPQQTIAENEEK